MFTPVSFYGGSDLNVYDDVYALFDASIGSTVTTTTWTAATSSLATAPTLTRTGQYITHTSDGNASYWNFVSSAELSGNIGVGSIGNNSGFTINLWIMPSSFEVAPAGQGVYWVDAQSGNDFAYNQQVNRFGSWNWYAANADTGVGGGSVGQFPSGTNTDWWMNTITWDGVNTRGQMKGTSTKNVTFPYNNPPAPGFGGNTNLRLGIVNKSATTKYFGGGKIAMVEMWNRGLTTAEVDTLYNTNKSRFGY